MTVRSFSLHVNGNDCDVMAEESATLLELLRGPLGLLGTKENCIEAECGVCTVLLDGLSVCSCILLAAQCEGRKILTIEGLAEDDKLHALQRTFIAAGAVQCGYCIPGMIMTAAAFLRENPRPTEAEIREGLAGTLCRCTGYQKIVDAVGLAARELRKGTNA